MSILNFIAKAKAAQQRLEPLLKASTQSPAGEALTRTMNPQELKALEDATVLLRRKSLADLKQGRLKSVHESGRTGAGSGAKRSAEVRAVEEPQMFGDKGQTYGYLTDDPFATLQGRFDSYYPDRGVQHFAPQNTLPQYGQYALELHPENRARTTITLNDSLDRTKGLYAMAKDILKGDLPQNMSVSEGSVLWDLARQYREAGETGSVAGFQSLMRQHGLEPIADGSRLGRLPRQAPRTLTGLRDSPLMRSELHFLNDPASLKNKLSLRDPTEYVEAQIHGDVTPEHVKRIYDLNYEPSLATERAVKKLGIEYVPRPMDTVYDQIKARAPRTMGELYELQDRLGVPPERRVMLRGEAKLHPAFSNTPMLPFKTGFARGGLAQLKECSYHG
jgi:hypothetical protein